MQLKNVIVSISLNIIRKALWFRNTLFFKHRDVQICLSTEQHVQVQNGVLTCTIR